MLNVRNSPISMERQVRKRAFTKKVLRGSIAPLFWAICIFAHMGHKVLAQTSNNTGTNFEVQESLENFSRTERSFSGGYEIDPPERPRKDMLDPKKMPQFDNSTATNVTFQYSKTVFLHCKIRNLGDRVVSWVRQRDLHILTVGTYTYTTDQRFTSIHRAGSEDWTLEIKYPQKRDAGVYECQISTEPKLSLSIRLYILVAKASIAEGPILYVQAGSQLNLTCTVTGYVTPPPFVFWYHNGKTLHYESHGEGVTVLSERGDTVTISRLHIDSVKSSNSGTYSCQPSFANSANTTVHVLNGEKPAAMQHGRQSLSDISSTPSLEIILLSLLWSLLML